MKEVIFHCSRFPKLGLTVIPFNFRDDDGKKKRAKHIFFGPDPVYGAGIFRAQDQDMADFVRNSEQFKNGKIIEVEDIKDIPLVAPVVKVKTGVQDSASARMPAGEPAPADGAHPVKAAKGPKRKK